MSNYKTDVARLMRTARGDSDADVALLEEAVRLADAHNDTPLGLMARLKLINAANFSGNHELVLVTFSWCLAQTDRDEQLRLESERRVLWYYKWVVESLSEYAQISAQQLETSFGDMTKRPLCIRPVIRIDHRCWRANWRAFVMHLRVSSIFETQMTT